MLIDFSTCFYICRYQQRGVYTIITALMMVALLGFIGLAIDASRQQSVHTELQNTADACALAAAMEFNGLSDAAVRASFAGAYVGGQRNYKNFQNSLVGNNVTVTFSPTLVGPFLSATNANGATVKFVRCTTKEDNFVNMFLKVLGIGNSNLSATAVASLQPSQSACSLPMAICKGTSGDITNFGYALNQGIGMPTPPSLPNPGQFGWANVLGTNDPGMTSLTDAFTSFGVCNVNTKSGRCLGLAKGAKGALETPWNSRFGLYKSGTGNLSPTEAVPDLTGYGYLTSPPGGNFADYRNKAAARTAYQGSFPGYKVVSNVHTLYGVTNRRLGILPVVDCKSTACGVNSAPIIGWACVLMLAPTIGEGAVEYLGRADAVGSPCVTAGVPGGADATGPLVPGLVQ